MKKAFFGLVIFFLLILVSVLSFSKFIKTPVKLSNIKELKIRCAIPYWDQKAGFNSLKQHIDSCDYTSVYWYYLDDNQQIQKYSYAEEDTSIISFAHKYNTKIFMTLTNLPEKGDWDSKRVEKMLSSKQSRQKHIQAINALLKSFNFDGVLIDYEAIDSSQKEKFSEFISELSPYLHKNNKLVAVAIHPKIIGTLPNNDIGVFQDWKAISRSTDIFSIMAYDHHYDTGSPGAVAPLDWVKGVIEFAKSENVPIKKIFLGISFTGFDWNISKNERATSVSYEDVQKLVQTYGVSQQWDNQGMSPLIIYTNSGEKHEVWYENPKSINAKINFAKNSLFGGINLWYLGSEETPDVWKSLK